MNVSPVFIEKPWGGSFIAEKFKLTTQARFGEAFLVSTLENLENMIGEDRLSSKLGKLPFLIKLIDANENLSIQVHPNDHHAAILENSVGKTECWLITDVQPDSGIYYGLKKGISTTHFYECVAQNRDVVSLLNFLHVKKGDFICVPAGTIHAIGAGVRLIEFQQSSGFTYRIWDWCREGRELHIEKALQVSNPKQDLPDLMNFSTIALGTFFMHKDFSLEKKSDDKILCSSPATPHVVNFDLENFSFTITT